MGVEVIGVLLLFGYGDAGAVLLSTEWTLQVVSYLLGLLSFAGRYVLLC